MRRDGFALLTVLWLLTLLAVVAAVSVSYARTSLAVGRNRLILARAGWAGQACEELAAARFARDSALGADSIELGRGTWCRYVTIEPAARLNVNLADSATLRAVLGADSLVAAVLDWRDADEEPHPDGAERSWYAERHRPGPRDGPLADVAELALVRGFDSSTVERLTVLLTTRSDGKVDVNAAPPEVLRTLPGVSPAMAEEIVARRIAGGQVGGAEGMVAMFPREQREAMEARFDTLARLVVAGPPLLTLDIEGGVHGLGPTARTTLTVTPSGRRLATLHRESE